MEGLDVERDQLIDDLEEFLVELLGCNWEDAQERGVGAVLKSELEVVGDDVAIADLLKRISILRHHALIEATQQKAKVVGCNPL